MIHRVRLSGAGHFDDWRQAARSLILQGAEPRDIEWGCDYEYTDDLFAAPSAPPRAVTGTLSVPRAFLTLAERLLCHNNPARFSLAYRLLWRLQRERNLLAQVTDADMCQSHQLVKSVDRDCHKMKAFVRFKEMDGEGARRRFVAWFEPDHYIIRRTAPFFQRRFTDMDWIIATPKGSAAWDGQSLHFNDQPQTRPDIVDETDDLWRTYFANIFNPARLKVKMMQSEMPKKYWKNLPEADLIPQLIRDADKRVQEMNNQTLNQTPPRFHQRLNKARST
ncbi:TIGR03915 family putative DNA repair protein [Asticcacaulis tiandongensis]|uniref:TIGR03915 family putative DNA repair protein n=1 Tax=Asticcacaulis tiandongensis TaxID=2565365 RepID=UPI00112B475C|nr:TIGR03915 family putative DNA repair protein [Asticcacaulis tiandongensis]